MPLPAALTKVASAAGKPKQADAEVKQSFPDAITTVLSTYSVYRDAYRTMLKVTLICGSVVALLIGAALFIIITAEPQDRFFTSSVTGHNERIYPADTAFDQQNTARIVRSVLEAMSFGYLNYEIRFPETRQAFKPAVFEALVKALTGAGGTDAMIANQMNFEATLDQRRPLQVIRAGISADLVYESTFDIPLLITIKKGPDLTPDTVTPWTARIVAQRSLNLDAPAPFLITRAEASAVGAPVAAPKPAAAPEVTP